jgi:hypothetical protein
MINYIITAIILSFILNRQLHFLLKNIDLSMDGCVEGAVLTLFIIIFKVYQGRIQDFKLGGRTKKNCAERREAGKLLGYFV